MKASFGARFRTLVIAALASSCGDHTAAPARDAVATLPKSTVISALGCRVELPGRWTRQPGSESLVVVRCGDRSEELTISSLSAKTRISESEMRPTLEKLTGVRRKAELGADPSARLAETTFDMSGALASARFTGSDSKQTRRFSNLTACSVEHVWMVRFEALDESEADFNARSTDILKSAVFDGR